jgi:hypothetical protein
VSGAGANAVETHTTTWNGVRGADNLPCEAGSLLWIFTGHDATSATLHLDGASYTGNQRGTGAYQFTTPGSGVTSNSSAYVVYTGPVQSRAVVTISHCDGGTTTTTVTVPTTVTGTGTNF